MIWKTDHLSGNTGFPAHAQCSAAGTEKVRNQCRQIDETNSFPKWKPEYRCHFQKLLIGAFQSGDGIDIDHRENNDKSNENGKVAGTGPDQGEDHKGCHGNGFEKEHRRLQKLFHKGNVVCKAAKKQTNHKCS